MTYKAREAYNFLVQQYKNGLEHFWANPVATPQALAAELGPSGAELFQLHGALKAAILAVNPSELLPEVSDYGTFTVNADGSLTIDSVTTNEPT